MSDVPPVLELMTVTAPHGAPTIAEAAKQLGVATEDIDVVFGVVPVDPDRGIYAVQVRADRLHKRPEGSGQDYHGPWSNPRIAPFGPVQDGTTSDDKNRR
jgi:hypothetical protein